MIKVALVDDHVVTKKSVKAAINQLIQKIKTDDPILRNLLIADALAASGYLEELIITLQRLYPQQQPNYLRC